MTRDAGDFGLGMQGVKAHDASVEIKRVEEGAGGCVLQLNEGFR